MSNFSSFFLFFLVCGCTPVNTNSKVSNHEHCIKKADDSTYETICLPELGGCRKITYGSTKCIEYACDQGYKSNEDGRCVKK